MPLSQEQKDHLTAEAEKRGLDPAKLIAAAEDHLAQAVESQPKDSGGAKAAKESGATPDQPKLFQYHLPFVTVKEVRQHWLGLTDSFPGDSEVASEWAAKHGGGSTDGGNAPPAA